jgi:hypothetical protein
MRRKLQKQHCRLRSQALDRRPDDLCERVRSIEIALVRAGNLLVSLDEEAEAPGYLRGIGAKLRGGNRAVVGAIDRDRAEEGMTGVGLETVMGERLLRGVAVVDDVLPSRKGPGGSAETDPLRKARGNRRDLGAERRRPYGRGLFRGREETKLVRQVRA